MSVVALVIAPSIALDAVEVAEFANEKAGTEVVANQIMKEVMVDKSVNTDGTVQAVVTITTTENGISTTEDLIFKGTEEEVKAELENLDGVKVEVKELVKKLE